MSLVARLWERDEVHRAKTHVARAAADAKSEQPALRAPFGNLEIQVWPAGVSAADGEFRYVLHSEIFSHDPHLCLQNFLGTYRKSLDAVNTSVIDIT